MNRNIRVSKVALLWILALSLLARQTSAAPFSRNSIIIEVNATAGDGGIQISLDAEGWRQLEVFDPTGAKVLDVGGSGSVGMTGITELFFESAEPSFEDLPLDQLLARFPAGSYSFRGTTVDGKRLTGRAPLSHSIPAGPSITSPEEGASLDPASRIAVDWEPVTASYPGTTSPVSVVTYQVIVERVKPQPLLAFSVFVPAAVTEVTIPAEFLQAHADYKFEVLAIDAGGNQTITEGTFTTGLAGSAKAALEPLGASGLSAGGRGTAENENSGPRPSAYLRSTRSGMTRGSTSFEFAIPREGSVALRVFDASGRLVRSVLNDRLPAGPHMATWDGRDGRGHPVGSGVYFAVLTGAGVEVSRKLVVAR